MPMSTFPIIIKSMETLGCHSNETTWATTIKKNKIYVETNVMNMYAKLSFIPLMASEEKLFE